MSEPPGATAAIVPARVAVDRVRSVAASHWPRRGTVNRLEPDCWPELRPSFRIAPGSKVVAIGSCFARNIERHLAILGFDVPAVALTEGQAELFGARGGDMLNVYTPVNICQELEWVAAIRDRDDRVNADDVLPLLHRIGDDRYIDTQLTVEGSHGRPLADHLDRRRLIYRIMREAFDCDLAVVTLGYIEAWWRLADGRAVTFNPRVTARSGTAEFGFRRLTFAEALAATETALALLLRNPRCRILITTSPVPLERTFTTDDVIVANAYSKSLLRTVAGVVSEQNDRVDYFPSYESVTLTRRDDVWASDLRHVETNFVGRVMARVVETYVDGGIAFETIEASLAFGEHVAAGRWDEAGRLYPQVRDATPPDAAALALALGEYEARLGDAAAAHGRLDTALDRRDTFAAGMIHLLRCARLAEELGDPALAGTLRADAIAEFIRDVRYVRPALRVLADSGWQAEAQEVIAAAERHNPDNGEMLELLADQRLAEGRSDEYRRLMRMAVAAGLPDASLVRFARLLRRADLPEEALQIVTRATAGVVDDDVFDVTAALLLKLQRNAELEAACRRRLGLMPGDADALGYLGMAMYRTGRRDAGIAAAAAAVAAGNARPPVVKLAQQTAPRSATPAA